MRPPFLPQDQVFWSLHKNKMHRLTQDISTDILVVGGGMAGLSAAQSFREKGLKVVVVEKNYCGSGASGKSSGFITPDSELSLHDFVKGYGQTRAKELWEFVTSGVNFIKNNIENYQLDCDYQVQDTLVVAHNDHAFATDIEIEHSARASLGYPSSLYTRHQLPAFIGSTHYAGGISYPGSFGINGYRYCLEMKRVLEEAGVRIYEDTPVIRLKNKSAHTPYGTINAEYIVVCADYGVTALEKLKDEVYHAQTSLMLSAPLTEIQIKTIFPQKNFMVWDTNLIYYYYRLTGDKRLLLGGGNLLYTYREKEKHNNISMAKKLTAYFSQKFPQIHVNFPYMWPGLIGISKDVLPIAGFDQDMPHIYYVAAAAGLPWASALGTYSAESIINKVTTFDHYFSPYRKQRFGHYTQAILGAPLTFALSNFLRVGSL